MKNDNKKTVVWGEQAKKAGKSSQSLSSKINKTVFTYIVAILLVVVIVVYALVYLKFTAKSDELMAANDAKAKEVAILKQYYDKLDVYQQNTINVQNAIDAMLDQYPADAREEDMLMLAVDIQKNNDIDYSVIAMEEKEGVYTVESNFVEAANKDGLSGAIVFAQKHASYSNTTDYENLKGIIKAIYDNDNRIGIDSIAYRKNEDEGILEGNISLYFYSASGTGKTYKAPDMAEYLNGTSDIFGLKVEK